MIYHGKTDTGKMRNSNQDDFAVSKLPDGSVIAVVCDGMGGANAGNVASKKATEVISSFFTRSYRSGLDSKAVIALLQSAILSANIEVYDMAQKDHELSGMGTTVVAAFVSKDFAVISHVGDSRAYAVGKEIVQLTRDHSIVQSLIESGKLTPEEARVHPRRNIITRALGIEPEVLVDSDEYTLKKGEALLLCSDGLSNYVSTDEIKEIINSNPYDKVPDLLIERANHNGGADNITVVIVSV
ncbi:MAG: Stp1/IreP family PP2C-type Ser/Thr phosphatase [Acutalibacteraceae bacterium]|jgi:serine/threonine protein phosphatase PrpC